MSYFSWQSEKDNYIKEYVYSNKGILSYELDNKINYVDKVYNTDGEIINLTVPDKRTVIMHCSKNNLNECIYFDENNSVDKSRENPINGIFVTLFLIAFGVFFVYEKSSSKKVRGNGLAISRIYLLYVFFLAFGMGLIIWQLYNAVKYYNLKNDNNVVTATIYSEIYNIGAENNLYKPISYYYVNNEKYIYVNDSYVKGILEDNLGKTLELYYKKDNPIKVSKKKNPVNFLLLLIGICFSIMAFPFVFFKKKMEQRIEKNLGN